jgi:predicted SPOUT superfamily RNA methylase MTH1
MRHQKFWIAVPDTILSDSSTLRDKTVKIGALARSCAIFKVHKILIYRDRTEKKGEATLIKTILEYLDTPQYLRKYLFKKDEILKFVGLLPPIRAPHHKLSCKLPEIQKGDYRDGVVFRRKGDLYVDVGLNTLVPLENKANEGSRVTVIFTSKYPDLRCKLINRELVEDYWGYDISIVESLECLRNQNLDMIILTSRLGIPITDLWIDFVYAVNHAQKVMVVFGSPRKGVVEILSREGTKYDSVSKYLLNTFPQQGVSTIRIEEALMGTLSIMNIARNLNLDS